MIRSKSVAVLAIAAGALGTTGVASAGGSADTKVTIKAAGTDLFGFVKSSKPKRCADGREVRVFKKTATGKQKVGSDTASLNGDRYQWSTGNTGQTGRFFAKAGRIPGCDGDKSKTIRVQR